MDRCLEVVDGARPNSSVIWQTQSSPPCKASNMRTRFSSASALVTAMNSRVVIQRISSFNEIKIGEGGFLVKRRCKSDAHHPGGPVRRGRLQARSRRAIAIPVQVALRWFNIGSEG